MSARRSSTNREVMPRPRSPIVVIQESVQPSTMVLKQRTPQTEETNMKLYVHILNTLAHAQEERGATMPEYGLMVALIAVVAAAGAGALGGAVNGLFQSLSTSISN